jgi:phenylacetate-CoA ligase
MSAMQKDRQQQLILAWKTFLNTSLDTLGEQQVCPEAAVLELFHSVAATVPAYQAFLAARDIHPTSIQTWADFQKLPPIDKQNYLQCYPLGDLCRDGKLETGDLIAVSSGSTGKPTFWPRFLTDELQIVTRFEQIFRDSFSADTRRTLAVICFPMGTWVGGLYTTNCCRYLNSKGYLVTAIAPGNNKEEIYRVVQELGNNFEQVVLLGYPPFIKDVIDTGIVRGITWQQYNLKMVFAGEVFSEEWRSLVGERTGSANPIWDSAALYGTADAGVLGNETPLSICIRRFLAAHPEAARGLFGESRLPTLVQYDPYSRFFEVNEGTLYFSGNNGIPLIRYHIADNGGIIPYTQMLEFLAKWGFDPMVELGGKPSRGIFRLPFVYIFGRANFTVSYFGANIYPENVTVGLEQLEIRDWVTGKFVMQVRSDGDRNRFLAVVVELAPGIAASESKQQAVALAIRAQLQRLNSEFANYVPPEYQLPQVTLTATGDPEYFPLGVKHRYTRPDA